MIDHVANIAWKVEEVISEERDEVQFYCTSPDDVNQYITKVLKGTRDEIDHNGWQWDYWITYTIDNKKYTLAGSGYYGNMSFSKYEE